MTSARVAVSVVFALHGIASGMWVSRIPAVQEGLEIGLGALGIALLGGGLGSLLAMLPMGALIAHVGSRRVTLGAGLGTAVAFVLLGLANSAVTLFGALVVWGAAIGTLDVAMNAQGSAIEQRRPRPIMSSLHGLWSVGSMTGAALGAILAALAVTPRTQFAVAAPLLAIAITLAARHFVSDRDQAAKKAFVWPTRALLPLALIVFCAVAVEGAMFDWSGVFMRRSLDASEGIAAAAPTFFAAAMAVGRLVGDQVTARLSGATVARGSALLALLGLTGVVLAPRPEVVFGALMLVGLGIAVLVPLAFSSAGRTPNMPASSAIAAVATVGYSAFLLAPPAIGLIAEQLTLRGSFALLLLALAVIFVLARAVRS
ncbi:MAG TPA: MFS transporter [Chloroflexota bacterium]|nr:MFS transporter [Chloroflexota bacterium]